MVSYSDFTANCEALQKRVADAVVAFGRKPNSVKILPVTKTHPIDAANFAASFGFSCVGENKVQEASAKIEQSRAENAVSANLNWELIGHLQSNKAKKAVEYFDRIQSVDSVKLLEKINIEAEKISKKQRILLQINSGRDPAKFGAEIEDAPALLERALELKYVSVEGLMAIAPLDNNAEGTRRCFFNLKDLSDELSSKFAVSLPELSMGMSSDLETAIEAGSTMIRVGTFLFGERHYDI